MHVKPHTRTLGEHRGLPQLSDRPSRQPLPDNPRTCVSKAPARDPSALLRVTSYRLGHRSPVGAVLAEQTDEWAEGRRYVGLDTLTRCRLTTIPTTEPEIGADNMPALSA
jgi:hypothetical protein